jgi:hypothetical protein
MNREELAQVDAKLKSLEALTGFEWHMSTITNGAFICRPGHTDEGDNNRFYVNVEPAECDNGKSELYEVNAHVYAQGGSRGVSHSKEVYGFENAALVGLAIVKKSLEETREYCDGVLSTLPSEERYDYGDFETGDFEADDYVRCVDGSDAYLDYGKVYRVKSIGEYKDGERVKLYSINFARYQLDIFSKSAV